MHWPRPLPPGGLPLPVPLFRAAEAMEEPPRQKTLPRTGSGGKKSCTCTRTRTHTTASSVRGDDDGSGCGADRKAESPAASSTLNGVMQIPSGGKRTWSETVVSIYAPGAVARTSPGCRRSAAAVAVSVFLIGLFAFIFLTSESRTRVRQTNLICMA